VIVLDSVAALVTKQELDGEIGDSTVGAQARLMSAAMRKLTALISKAQTVCIFTNQIREKIGVMFGNPETTPGDARSSSSHPCGSISAGSGRSSPRMVP
jgi:recombination protein RecA